VRAKPVRQSLEQWYEGARRDLPWRRTADPYRIWLSEVMLQQTRVAAVLPYYERFLARFPDVAALARAPEADVLACWSGLGYYSRARNLHRAAKLVASQGEFPRDCEALRELPGVGEYTAAAIASIAFGQPHAVVDGNAARVLARLLCERGDIASSATRARLRDAAAALLDRKRPGVWNQALMELGATVCVPRQPACAACPLARFCEARRAGLERELPLKLPKPNPERIEKTVLLIERANRILLWQRDGASPRLAGFWDLPEPHQLPDAVLGDAVAALRHSIVNHRYSITVLRATVPRAPAGFRWFPLSALSEIPLATVARKALLAAHAL
jgi:A/G-specific adenine glycosylase